MTPKLGRRHHCMMLDPPWPQDTDVHRHSKGDKRRRKLFDTMSVPDICKVPIRSWAAPDCHVFTWATQVSIQWVFDVLKRWRVRYRFTITWDKNRGIGTQHLYRDSEFLVYGTLGRYTGPDRTLRSIYRIPAHGLVFGEKPQEMYDIIADATPGPHIDIFARQLREGWNAYGTELGDPPINQRVLA